MKPVSGSLMATGCLVVALCACGGGGQDVTDPSLLPPLPLSVEGRYVLDASGERFRMVSVNWYGGHDALGVTGGLDFQHRDAIAAVIREMGFNSVRLTFSNEMLTMGAVDPATVSANPDLVGRTALEVFDAVVEALTSAGVVVILNNHTSHAMWCCNLDSDGLWFNKDFPESVWFDDWVALARRYADNPGVAGADLRNEIRIAAEDPGTGSPTPNWGEEPNDWHAAATEAGNRILAENPDLLIIVEGINFPRTHLMGVPDHPVVLDVPGRLVYAGHNYSHTGPTLSGPKYSDMEWDEYSARLDEEFGFVVEPGQPYTAPVWLSEFGCSPDESNREWFTNMVRYIRERDMGWAYWPLNAGPKADGGGEPYALLEDDWITPRQDWRIDLLKTIQ